VSAPVVFAVAFGSYYAGHLTADYWTQTNAQALGKAAPGWAGQRACAAHVATYTVTLAAFLALAAWRLGLPVSPGDAAAGLGVSAATHYFADRKAPLRRLAAAIGKDEFWDYGDGLASGAAHLDQAWHVAWLFAAALITAGGAR
jgi:hypothetical protein